MQKVNSSNSQGYSPCFPRVPGRSSVYVLLFCVGLLPLVRPFFHLSFSQRMWQAHSPSRSRYYHPPTVGKNKINRG